MDAAEAFSPGAAQELHQDGLGLVVEGVGGEDGVGLAGAKEFAEGDVAEVAGGFFRGLSGSGDAGGRVGVVDAEGDVEAAAERLDEDEVGVGLFAAQTVVDVDGREAYAEGVARQLVGGVEQEQHGD